jgi:hypothetical protein
MTTTTLHATPYNINAAGFYFHDLEEYEKKSAAHFDSYGNIVEEFEIQLIDSEDAQLFIACDINQSNLNTWFEVLEFLHDHEKISLFYLLTNGYDRNSALEKLDEPCIIECNLKDAASELFDVCYANSIPENLRYYIDYERFARDCDLSGDMNEFEYNGSTYTCTNANCL